MTTIFHAALGSAVVIAALAGGDVPGRAADMAMSEMPVKQYLAAWDAHDVDGMLKTFTDDAVIVLPQQAPIKGKDNVRPLLAAFVKEFSQANARFSSGQFTAEGSIAYLLWTGDTPSTKYPFGADTFVVRDGRIAYLTLAFVAEPKTK